MAKVIYIDEAGTDAKSPVTVVAGTVIDIDNEWHIANERLEYVRSLVPPELRENFIFHATDLYSGSKPFYRKKYDKPVRFPIIEAMLQSFKATGFPVFYAYQWAHPKSEGWNPKNEIFFRHLTTFTEALKVANQLMRDSYPGERAIIAAEDAPNMRQYLTKLPEMLRAATTPEYVRGPHAFDAIIDAPNFIPKTGAPMLQFADAAAFAVRHYLSDHKDGLWAMQHLAGRDDVEALFERGPDLAMSTGAFRWSKGQA